MLGDEVNDYRGVTSLARSKKAAMVFILNTTTDEEFKDYAGQFESFLSDGRLSLKKPSEQNERSGLFFVSPSVAANIFNTSLEKLTSAAAGNKSALRKVAEGKVSVVEVERPTPLAFALLVDRAREQVTSEKLGDRIRRMAAPLERAADGTRFARGGHRGFRSGG